MMGLGCGLQFTERAKCPFSLLCAPNIGHKSKSRWGTGRNLGFPPLRGAEASPSHLPGVAVAEYRPTVGARLEAGPRPRHVPRPSVQDYSPISSPTASRSSMSFPPLGHRHVPVPQEPPGKGRDFEDHKGPSWD